jgi:hypothetical protein
MELIVIVGRMKLFKIVGLIGTNSFWFDGFERYLIRDFKLVGRRIFKTLVRSSK